MKLIAMSLYLICVVAVSCTSTSSQPHRQVTVSDFDELPIQVLLEAHGQHSAAAFIQVEEAVAECMITDGFKYYVSLVEPTLESSSPLDSVLDSRNNYVDYAFGFGVSETAASLGEDSAQVVDYQNESYVASLSDFSKDAYNRRLWGDNTGENGCLADARSQVNPPEIQELVAQLRSVSQDIAIESDLTPEVVSQRQSVFGCLEREGVEIDRSAQSPENAVTERLEEDLATHGSPEETIDVAKRLAATLWDCGLQDFLTTSYDARFEREQAFVETELERFGDLIDQINGD